MRKIWVVVVLLFLGISPVSAHSNEDSSEPIVLRDGDVYDGGGQMLIACERPAVVMKGEGSTLRNVTIEQCPDVPEGTPAIEVTGRGHRLEDVKLRVMQEGIHVNEAENVSVIRPIVSGIGEANGITVLNSNRVTIEDAVIHHVRDGIYIETGSSNVIKRARVSASRYGMHLMFAERVTIDEAEFTENGAGIMIMGTEAVHLRHSRIHDQEGAAANGVMLFEAKGTTFESNVIYGNRVGLYAEKSSRTVLTDNDVFGNDIGFRFQEANDMVVSFNRLYGNRYPIALYRSSKNHVYGNEWGGTTLDLNRDGFSEIGYRADPYLFTLTDANEAFELLYGAPGLVVLEQILRSQEDETLHDDAPSVGERKRIGFQFSPYAFSLFAAGIGLWIIGRKTR